MKAKNKSKKVKKGYFKAVKSEMSKVVWPKKSDLVKYTVATIVFVIVLVGFFLLLNLGLAGIKGVLK